jgi:hypothetical protein
MPICARYVVFLTTLGAHLTTLTAGRSEGLLHPKGDARLSCGWIT